MIEVGGLQRRPDIPDEGHQAIKEDQIMESVRSRVQRLLEAPIRRWESGEPIPQMAHLFTFTGESSYVGVRIGRNVGQAHRSTVYAAMKAALREEFGMTDEEGELEPVFDKRNGERRETRQFPSNKTGLVFEQSRDFRTGPIGDINYEVRWCAVFTPQETQTPGRMAIQISTDVSHLL